MRRSVLNLVRIGAVILLTGLATVLISSPAQAARSTTAVAQCWNYWWPVDDVISFGAHGSGYQGHSTVHVWLFVIHNSSTVHSTNRYVSVSGGFWNTPYDEIEVGQSSGTYTTSTWVTSYDGEQFLGSHSASCSL